MGVLKAAGVALCSALAVPIAGLSGIASVVLTLVMLASFFGMGPASMDRLSFWGKLTSPTALYWLIAVGVFTLAFRFLAKLQLNSKKLVADLNAREGLALDAGLLLGYPSPIFMVFDRQNRKLAVCNVARGESQIYDFSWVLRWDITFREVERTQMGGGTRQINANGMSVPNFERVTEIKDYAIALQTADIHEPVMKFPMSRKQAEIWCARLNAIFNG